MSTLDQYEQELLESLENDEWVSVDNLEDEKLKYRLFANIQIQEQKLNSYHPETIFPPGDILAEVLEERGMTQAELAIRLGYSKKAVNEVIQAKSALTPDFALALERVFGTPAHVWNRVEQLYREYLARVNEIENLEQHHLNWLEEIPYKAMIKNGWIKKFKEKTDQLIEVLNFFGVASPVEWANTWEKKLSFNFRKSDNGHEASVIAWLRQGEILASQVHCQPYDKQNFKETLHQIRSLTRTEPDFYKDELVRLCAQCGVAVVFVPELTNAKVSGVTHWLNPDKALIQLSLRYKKDDHFWFSFFHEAGHILLHGKKEVFIEDEDCKTDKETEADNFAEELLIPKKIWNEIADIFPYSAEIIETYAEELDISPGIIVGRLQKEGKLPWTHLNKLKKSCKWVEN
ncbi:ImmA/IrrE family metallo-endopeptidase [Picosynechococcus sp. NKBG15041c]|uniref:ImmA/IrrE family metallo-endopeptidase n=1 Tax=Picosynechococcus sp. NKBG15041c TaxID=1407650 RepID=UPI0003FC508D|nr:ImmA/IrrE family metallo-endopeptidase [Picosynechococcus sp. NKBG15041c]